jgi:hypothetical protein
MKTHPAITRIAAALSWINAPDIPDNIIDSPAYGAQEQADVRAIIARVKELRINSNDPKANHWTTARAEFIERVLAEAGVTLPNTQGQP